jgi:hypothetical protein
MSKMRYAAKIKPWLSARKDCKEGRFIQVGNSLLLSPKLHKLTVGARYAYLCMTIESGGKREFSFTKSVARKYDIGAASHSRHVKELLEAGFIECITPGGLLGLKNVYKFLFSWKS